MANKPQHPPLTAEAFDAMLERSALFQQMRNEMAAKAAVADARLCAMESDLRYAEERVGNTGA